MDLFKTIYPDDVDNIIFYKDQIKIASKWLSNFKNNIDRSKKALLIIGDTGSGKTTLAHLLLKKFGYQIIELNATDIRSQKKIGDFLHKSLGFNNVIDMFYEKKRPIGLVLDELETLCQNTDKGGLSEFIQILKDNQKYEKNKLKLEELNNKKKTKKNTDTKLKIDMNKFIFIENPIICTYTDYNDKKINELKKFCQVINLKNIKFDEYNDFIKYLKKKHSILKDKTISKEIFQDIYKECNNDIRKFIQSIQNLHLYSHKKIDNKIYNILKSLNDTTKNDVQLSNAVDSLLNEKLPIKKLDLLFYLEPYHLPYTIYQNIINFVNNTDLKNDSKLELYSKYLNNLSSFDKVNNLIYDANDWVDVDNYLKLYGVYYPNYDINNYTYKKKMKTEIEFTNIHNKASQMLVNKKLISNAKYSLNKKYSTVHSTILNTEILFHYFNEFRECIMEENFKNLSKKKLIVYMNHYKINYDSLENILKIEKINKDEDKRKKNITVLLKEKIIENLDITLRTGV
jgi:hypothetical protein